MGPGFLALAVESVLEQFPTYLHQGLTADAWEEAVALARTTPTLAVGLHLVLVDGRSVLPHKAIRHLVDERGRFPDDPLGVGLRYAFSRAARAELARQVTAHFERFAVTGLPLSHVDGHARRRMTPSPN